MRMTLFSLYIFEDMGTIYKLFQTLDMVSVI
jgi:hypothetical protein